MTAPDADNLRRVDLELTGRRAVVTGGSRGIGLAVGRALAAEGADVALVARTENVLRRAADEVARDSGREVIAVPADTGVCGSDVPPLVGSVLTGTGLTVAQAIAALERGETPPLSDVQRRIVEDAALRRP